MKKFNQQGSGLLSLLFTVLIIGLIYYFAFGSNKNKDSKPRGYLDEMTVQATSYRSIMDAANNSLEANKARTQNNDGL